MTKRNGFRNGKQLYKCQNCGHQFRQRRGLSEEDIWSLYLDGKQTAEEVSRMAGVSLSTVRRRLSLVERTWVQPCLTGEGYVHIDATYWGHNWGVMLALDDATGRVLYMDFIRHETVNDYRTAIESIEARGYCIKGLIIDGMHSLFKEFARYPIQMCHFHMISIIRRYLTKNPRLKAARELRRIVFTITITDRDTFICEYQKWKSDYAQTINRRSVSKKTGSSHYTHRRLRTAMHSVDFYLPYLFTFQREDCQGMPNTNNKIEGTFTDLKKNLNVHSGLSMENRKRFICGFFLASCEI